MRYKITMFALIFSNFLFVMAASIMGWWPKEDIASRMAGVWMSGFGCGVALFLPSLRRAKLSWKIRRNVKRLQEEKGIDGPVVIEEYESDRGQVDVCCDGSRWMVYFDGKEVHCGSMETTYSYAAALSFGLSVPVPIVITCPRCSKRHIDEGKFATKEHHTHACQGCGLAWRPAVVATFGVAFLPGFKNDE